MYTYEIRGKEENASEGRFLEFERKKRNTNEKEKETSR